MNVLLVGYEHDIDLPWSSIKKEHQTAIAILGDQITDIQVFNYQVLSSYDQIVIAIKETYLAQEFYNLLRSILKHNYDMIIDFYQLYRATLPPCKVDRVMADPFHTHYNGMILGISHAEVGILPHVLNGDFCNLAVSSQDIYYNMKTLKYCIDNHPNKIQNLQYLIFEMFDYTYFNYDVSLSKAASSYYNRWGGFRHDPHNFQDNPSFSMDHDTLLFAMFAKLYPNLNATTLDLWDRLFENVHSHDNYRGFNGYSYDHLQLHLRTKIVTDEEISAYNATSSIVQKTFDSTIKENVHHFNDLLRSTYNHNPDIKMFCILMPRYFEAYNKVRAIYAPWKERFYAIIKKSQVRYPFTFLDLTEDAIAQNREWYFDVSHFNYYGAIQFSQRLNSILSI